MRSYVWAFVFSVAFHAVLLSQINLKSWHQPSSNQPVLTVNLVPSTLVPQRNVSSSRSHSEEKNIYIKKSAQKHDSNDTSLISAPNEIPNVAQKIEVSSALDMGQLHNQAREYADKEFSTSEPVFSINGDYYGTYTGSDSGTFYFHLDRKGIASGNGQSNTFGVSFIITGNATSNGIIQMSGSGRAGDAKFEGKLDIKTGMLSGTWSLMGVGNGVFSGRHE